MTHESSQIDFEALLEPYRTGGTPENPVRRTMGTILDYLLNKRKYPREIVGAAVLSTFCQMQNGKVFEGKGSSLPEEIQKNFDSGTYGAPGRELVTFLRVECDRLLHAKIDREAWEFAEMLRKAVESKPGLFRRMWRRIKGRKQPSVSTTDSTQ